MNRVEELTEKYLDEVLSPSEGRELANHLGAEPEAARQFLAFYSQDRALIELSRSVALSGLCCLSPVTEGAASLCLDLLAFAPLGLRYPDW